MSLTTYELGIYIEHLETQLDDIRVLADTLCEGKGRFNRDAYIHCSNTVEDMKELARQIVEVLER